ncbi:ion transporter [Streptomyces sp. NPDC057877]|uniref:ion transporter n=1 Tax=Streptomyces sp. NPDC057877 TaxID=3346269 RepID=UPI0036AA2B07
MTPHSAAVRARFAVRCRTVVDARPFSLAVLAVILFNAVLLGLETYDSLAHSLTGPLRWAEHGCLAVFSVELLLRLGAHADRPARFWRDPWNVFDVLVVVSALLPLVRENATVLRLLRLARVLRTARFLPQLRILLLAVSRSLPGTASFLFVGGIILYVYAMVGWMCFAASDPGHFGSIGRAMLTLFLLTTLDGLGETVHSGLEVSRLSIVYYGSYVLLASFVLVNVLIGVVLNSLDEAREMEAAERAGAVPAQRGGPARPEDAHGVHDRITAMREALDALERQLPERTARPGPRGHS